jgi:hypothetical protein
LGKDKYGCNSTNEEAGGYDINHIKTVPTFVAPRCILFYYYWIVHPMMLLEFDVDAEYVTGRADGSIDY